MSSIASCWTCRLRRKKCDRALPTCNACAMLDITCHYSEKRPNWMDGGAKQSEMTHDIRAKVRQGAEARRERQYIQVMPLYDIPRKTEKISSVSGDTNSETIPDKLGSALETFRETGDQTHFTTMFLDHVFPFLFPFYHPSILEGGRAWLLAALRNNEALYHCAMSLSSYFFTLVLLKPPGVPQDSCEQTVWDTLERHMGAAVEAIRRNMAVLDKGGNHVTVFEIARLLESIIQLLVFETAIARQADWTVHLSAALSLFIQILQRFGTGPDGQPDMSLVMSAMHQSSIFDNVALAHPVWNCEQGAFRFFASVLLYADVLSSTSLETIPRLRQYHKHLLASSPVDHPDDRLQLEKSMGCQGWVLMAIGDITAMAAQKKEAKADGSKLPQEEFKSRSQILAMRLDMGMAEIEWATQVSMELDPVAMLRPYYGSERSVASATVTRIWVHAARIYLSITTSGWQPENLVLRESVERALALFSELSSPAHLHNLAWPLCVAGCMATAAQEQDFRDVVWSMDRLQAFGTVGESLRIMESVWNMRKHMDKDEWTLSDCFGILGSKVLLI